MVRCTRKALVTGGAGFLGSHLVKNLIDMNDSVVVLDDFSTGRIENLRSVSRNDGFHLVTGDVRDKEAVGKAMEGVDSVVHLAALIDVDASITDPSCTFDVNVSGSLNVLVEAVRQKVRRLVYASSAAVYGEQGIMPLSEDRPFKPISPYGASKAAAEALCQAFYASYNLEAVNLRFFNIYGPGQEFNPYSGVIARFLENAVKDSPLVIYGRGEQTRDFIYVDDAVQAVMHALENGNVAGETFNVCTGKPTTITDLAQIIKEITGKNLRIEHEEPRKGDIEHNYGDVLKAKKILGFEACVDLKDGIRSFLNSKESHAILRRPE